MALKCSREEVCRDGLNNLVPRKEKGGRKPIVLNWETEEKQEGRWEWRRDKPPGRFSNE